MIEVQVVAPQQLRASEYNPRSITDENRERLKAGLLEFGFVEPIVVRREDGTVIGGHQRLAIAQAHPDEFPTVPVVYLDGLSDERTKALNILLNNPHAQGQFNDEALAALLAELDGAGLAEYTGFPAEEVAALLEAAERAAQEAAGIAAAGAGSREEAVDVDLTPPEVPTSRRGEVYALGRHRVMCGDATNAEHVATLLDGAEPALMVTDPPYGIEYTPQWRDAAFNGGEESGRRRGEVANDDEADWREAWRLFPGDVAYVYHDANRAGLMHESLAAAGLALRYALVWVKPHFTVGRGHYHWRHEAIAMAVREGSTAGWAGDRSQTTVWEIARDRPTEVDADHGTQKPLECMERPVRHHEGDVYDPFGGTGTTLIAAERQGRTAFIMELDPRWCDVIRRRWDQFTAGADDNAADASD
jgi:DNA modification methylase